MDLPIYCQKTNLKSVENYLSNREVVKLYGSGEFVAYGKEENKQTGFLVADKFSQSFKKNTAC